jgi:hypothetical protein
MNMAVLLQTRHYSTFSLQLHAAATAECSTEKRQQMINARYVEQQHMPLGMLACELRPCCC